MSKPHILLALGTYTRHWIKKKVNGEEIIVGHYYTPNLLGTFHPLYKLDWKLYARRPMARFII